ncbi:hypothetical protein AVEN_9273-1 [Araneus ventricosus]|uniref:Uncharacterized protein n=1 Tax=Araneus ventricosus TaxID=182803 RepID=A0A4Y2JRI0_ARAVE|nr:hypothetical protein AVEN_9273-1 [Araneus ventricosus]
MQVSFITQAIHRSSKMEFLDHGKKKAYCQGQKPVKFEANESQWWNSKELKSNTQSAVSDLRPRCKGSGNTKYLPTLTPRDEGRNETQIPTCGGRGLWVGRILRL